MHIDFSSAIDNARFFAARESALRRPAAPAVMSRPKSGSGLTAAHRALRAHASACVAAAKPSSHAH